MTGRRRSDAHGEMRALPRRDVHVWLARLRDDTQELRDAWTTLDAQERESSQRLHRSADRARYAWTRAHLRRLLATYVGVGPEEVTISATSDGKPELAGKLASRSLHFNVSHSGALAAIVVARHAVGVDVEQIRSDISWRQIAIDFFSPSELGALEQLAHADRVRAFFDCWVRKEAYLKAVGIGLRRPTATFTVPVLEAEGEVLDLDARAPRGVGATPVWSIRSLAVDPGYAAAVCARPDATITTRWIPPA